MSVAATIKRRWVRRVWLVMPFVWQGLLPVICLLLLTVYGLLPFARSIEAAVQRQTRGVLDAQGYAWTTLQVSGQQVIVGGVPPAAGDGARALDAARAAACSTWAGRLRCPVEVTGSFAMPAVAGPEATSPPISAAPAAAQQIQVCEQALASAVAHSKIEFASASDQIKASSGSVLAALAKSVRECPGVIGVEGHTDSTGSAETNRMLSNARAAAVRDALIARGIPAERLVSHGFSADKPIADNSTAAGRAQNRRIEFHVVSSDPQ